MTWILVFCRSLLEMVFWLLVGRWSLALLTGESAQGNGVVRLFDFLLSPLRGMTRWLWPAAGLRDRDIRGLCLVVLVWLVCGVLKLLL